MKEIYRLHEKATALLELCKQEEERIKDFNDQVHFLHEFKSIAEKYNGKIDICERALKRLKYSYMKVLMQIAEL
jgi:hypothetical protein